MEFKALTPRTITSPGELLAELDRVRTQGWCVLDQELELGLMSVAAPVRNAAGKVVAAVNVSLQAQNVAALPEPAAYIESVRHAIVQTAGLISADIAAKH